MIQSASPVVQALLGTLMTWGLTALGASVAFFVRGNQVRLVQDFAKTKVFKDKQSFLRLINSNCVLNICSNDRTEKERKSINESVQIIKILFIHKSKYDTK